MIRARIDLNMASGLSGEQGESRATQCGWPPLECQLERWSCTGRGSR